MRSLKNKVDDIIKSIEYNSSIDKYYTPQIEIIEKYMNADFLYHLNNISEFSFIEKLSSIHRTPTNLKLEDVIHNSESAIACGIKVVKRPLSKFTKWDKWEGGYIEGFCRMDSDNPYEDWFVFMYIKMKYLEKILHIYEDYLYLI